MLTNIFGDISVEEEVVMHEDVLKIEKRGLGNNLSGRRVEVRVSIAGGGRRLRSYGISW